MEARNKLIEDNVKLGYWGFHRLRKRYPGVDPDELLSLAMYMLVHCAEHYDPEKGVKFSHFYALNLDWKAFYEFIRPLNRLNPPLETVSFETVLGEDFRLDEILVDSKAAAAFRWAELKNTLQTLLTPDEFSLLYRLYVARETQAQIAETLMRSQPTVARRVAQILKKVRKELEK